MRHLLFTSLVFMVFNACKKPQDRTCFKSAGEDIEISYPLEDFTFLDCFGNYKLNLIQDSTTKIVLKGGENLVSQIDFQQKKDSLYIENNNKCRFLRKYDKKVTIDLHYKDLDYFKYDGGDTVVFVNPMKSSYLFFRMRDGGGSVFLNLDCDYVDLNLESGSGDYNVKGFSHFARLYIQSTGHAFCDSLTTNIMMAQNHGTGNLHVNPGTGIFMARVNHIGNIFYRGNPSEKTITINGSGEIIKVLE